MSNKRKQLPLRISAKLYEDIASWAEDDFRSINGQIEYLLSMCVRRRKKSFADANNINSDKDSSHKENLG